METTPLDALHDAITDTLTIRLRTATTILTLTNRRNTAYQSYLDGLVGLFHDGFVDGNCVPGIIRNSWAIYSSLAS